MDDAELGKRIADTGLSVEAIAYVTVGGAAVRALTLLAAAHFHQQNVGYVGPDQVLATAKSWMKFVADKD